MKLLEVAMAVMMTISAAIGPSEEDCCPEFLQMEIKGDLVSISKGDNYADYYILGDNLRYIEDSPSHTLYFRAVSSGTETVTVVLSDSFGGQLVRSYVYSINENLHAELMEVRDMGEHPEPYQPILY